MQGEPSAWVDGGHWSTTEQVVAKRGDLLPLSTRGTVCESFVVKARKKYHRSHHSQNRAISARPTAQVSVAPVTM